MNQSKVSKLTRFVQTGHHELIKKRIQIELDRIRIDKFLQNGFYIGQCQKTSFVQFPPVFVVRFS